MFKNRLDGQYDLEGITTVGIRMEELVSKKSHFGSTKNLVARPLNGGSFGLEPFQMQFIFQVSPRAPPTLQEPKHPGPIF